ncbi:MAG TPA: hypothetical protein VF464_02040 [Candidatus Methylomirabilis sp.]
MNPSSLLLAVAMVTLYVFLWIGAPILLVGWLRSRRQEAIQRQIKLTDAIDARLGSIVSPVVTKPLWGPWRVRIAMPLIRPAPVGRILAITHGVLSGIDRVKPGRYQIVLTPKERHPSEGRMGRCALHVQR